jgi:hypothetical protein
MRSDPSDELVLTHAPGRTAVFVAAVLLMATSTGLTAFNELSRRASPFDLIGVAVTAMLVYIAIMAAVQAVLRRPLLQTSAAGIAITNPWGRLFVPWSDIVNIAPGRFRWLRVTLRAGTRPVGSIWVRLLSASLWVGKTVAVQMFTTVPRPDEAAEALRRIQSRRLAT